MRIYRNTSLPILNDDSLYLEGEESTYKVLDICKKLNEPIDEKYNIFVYWIGENVNYKHSVVLKSFLATQNLNNATLKIYCDKDLSKNIFFKDYTNIPQIEFHIFNVEEEIKGTIFENRFKYINEIKYHIFNPAYESDFFRLLMLQKYGGIYIDFDVLLLRDLSPLLKYDFLYQWGAHPNNMINGAIMHLRKDSYSNNLMSNLLLDTPALPGSGSLTWASDLYIRVKEISDELVIFPATFFNTEWQWNLHSKAGYNLNSFKSYEFSNYLFEGCFSWHWHNNWEQEIEKDSKFYILDKILEKKIKEKNERN